MKKFILGLVAVLLLAAAPVLAQNVKNYKTQGGAADHIGGTLDIDSGGTETVDSGGTLNVASGGAFKLGGTAVTATAAQLNNIPPTTSVTAELNTLTGLPAAVTMTATPATGTCAVQLTFKDSTGAALGHVVSGYLYFSNSAGTAVAAATSAATLTNGAIQELVTGKADLFITSAAGLLGFTVTAGTGTYYASIVLPNGRVVTTGAIVVN